MDNENIASIWSEKNCYDKPGIEFQGPKHFIFGTHFVPGFCVIEDFEKCPLNTPK